MALYQIKNTYRMSVGVGDIKQRGGCRVTAAVCHLCKYEKHVGLGKPFAMIPSSMSFHRTILYEPIHILRELHGRMLKMVTIHRELGIESAPTASGATEAAHPDKRYKLRVLIIVCCAASTARK